MQRPRAASTQRKAMARAAPPIRSEVSEQVYEREPALPSDDTLQQATEESKSDTEEHHPEQESPEEDCFPDTKLVDTQHPLSPVQSTTYHLSMSQDVSNSHVWDANSATGQHHLFAPVTANIQITGRTVRTKQARGRVTTGSEIQEMLCDCSTKNAKFAASPPDTGHPICKVSRASQTRVLCPKDAAPPPAVHPQRRHAIAQKLTKAAHKV